jgi:hypothetical protein
MATSDRTGRLPQGTTKLVLTMVAAILFSLGGVVFAVRWGSVADGGRGGAIAVALTFLMLFLGRGTAEAALEAKLPEPTEDGKKALLEVAKVRNAVAAMLDWSGSEKLYLTISSVVGTLFWGFGDVAARWLGAAP